MTVTARFFVQNIEQNEYNKAASTVRFSAVCRGSHNKQWAAATPSGWIEMTILNDKAASQFVLHEEYELTFQRVSKPEQGDGHEPRVDYAPYDVEKSNPICELCGMFPVKNEDGSLDWSAHQEFYRP